MIREVCKEEEREDRTRVENIDTGKKRKEEND